MSILTQNLPNSVVIDGKSYEIDVDFTTSIKYEQLILDDDIPREEKIMIALNLYYPIIPENTVKAMEQIQWFYSADNENKKSLSKSADGQRIYDFDIDAPYIFSAFLSEYHIDLTSTNLHWWVFRALFTALDDRYTIGKIMNYRAMDLKKLKGEQKKYYAKLKRLYALPTSKKDSKTIDTVQNALLCGGDVSKVLANFGK